MDLSLTTAPDSTQVNAEDFLAGPRTVTITGVRAGTAEQPVNIDLAEYPDRAYRPGKSMRRVLVAAWGADSSVYVGRRMTLFCDPSITFGRDRVGGIRIQAMSDLKKPLTIALTVTRGKRAPYTVQPLADAPTPAPTKDDGVTGEQLTGINEGLSRLGITDRETKLATVCQIVDRELGSAKDLTADEGAAVLEWIAAEEANAPADGEWPETATIPGA
jgi:hypothetical protein